jgi:hypothetical protein
VAIAICPRPPIKHAPAIIANGRKSGQVIEPIPLFLKKMDTTAKIMAVLQKTAECNL